MPARWRVYDEKMGGPLSPEVAEKLLLWVLGFAVGSLLNQLMFWSVYRVDDEDDPSI